MDAIENPDGLCLADFGAVVSMNCACSDLHTATRTALHANENMLEKFGNMILPPAVSTTRRRRRTRGWP